MSDHFSGPAVMGDPAVDITDLYAFPSPERPGNLVLIMDVFPLANAQSYFSDVLTYRFRLRPVTADGARFIPGSTEHIIDVTFTDVAKGTSTQTGNVVTSDGRRAGFVVERPTELDGMRIFAGLVSDPFFMDVEAGLRTTTSGKLAFSKRGTNSVESRDVLTIVVEVPIASIVQGFGGTTLIGAIAEDIVTRRGKPIRLERLGRAEIKNFIIQDAIYDPKTFGVELRDLYNREDAFDLSPAYRPLYESRFDANLAMLDAVDGDIAWPRGPDGRHPLRDLLVNDFLVVDLSRPFAPGGFLEIERAMLASRPHTTHGGRWITDDILDELLTLLNGDRKRLGDGVDAPTKAPSLLFPYQREPSQRTDLPLPAFLQA